MQGSLLGLANARYPLSQKGFWLAEVRAGLLGFATSRGPNADQTAAAVPRSPPRLTPNSAPGA